MNSCQKIKAKKFSGQYSCKVQAHYWESGGPMDYYEKDSIYSRDIKVKRVKKMLQIFNYPTFNVTEIEAGQTLENFSGCTACGITIRFENDSLFIKTSSGGNGGGSSQKYACKKQ
ncbi:hypothetical protein [Putridiphycobacter roseus]|uniref:hypothetical protein n=1 Tax=Putridiphycobacter roseus TaxID=2219161 RepID=UPI0011B84010|nr:hypothetical protein [Putridiphycobacter roseus]